MGANASKIFRYKLSDDIMLDIAQFAKIHELDDRHTYKEAWIVWLNENQDQVDREMRRLQDLDYQVGQIALPMLLGLVENVGKPLLLNKEKVSFPFVQILSLNCALNQIVSPHCKGKCRNILPMEQD